LREARRPRERHRRKRLRLRHLGRAGGRRRRRGVGEARRDGRRRAPRHQRVLGPLGPLQASPMFDQIRGIVQREKKHLEEELARTQTLRPLLMKPRNGAKWTKDEKRELVDHLKRIGGMGRYVALLLLPGGLALLPLLAWWLDRRRDRRPPKL